MNAIRCIIIIIVLTAQSQTILAMKALVKKQEEIAFQQQQANDAIEKERIERENKAQDDRQKAKQLHEEKEKLARAEEDRKKREQEEKRKQQELRKKAEQEEQKQQDEVRKKLEREELERTKKQEDESKRAFGIRPLIILFDPSNDDGYKGPGCGIETGAMMMTFRDALKYDIPIIADSWFLGYAQTCSEVQPDLLRWTIYTLKDKSIPVILFIPKQGIYQPYLEKLQTFSYGGATKKLSDGELLLGIKLHNFDQINALSSLAKPEKRIEDLACLKDVLITHNDLKGIGEQFGNRWDIFLTGHGGPQRTIAGMLVNDFKHFLKFLNGAIGTRSLFYDTCFAGAHLTDAYQDPVTSTEMRDIDFNFLIISATAFSKGSSANAHSNFQAYFTGLDNYFEGKKVGNENTTLTDIVQHLNRWEKTFTQNTELQLPTIRFPHTEWFKITELDTRIFTVNNSVISRTINQSKKEIKIPAEVKIIVVESLYIPISIIIEGDNMPLMIPLNIINQDYFFKEIVARGCALTGVETTLSFEQMLKKLLAKCPDVGKFLIETLIINVENLKKADGNDLAWNTQPVTLKNVIINPKESIRAMMNNEHFQYDLLKQHWNILDGNQAEKWSDGYYEDYNLKPDITDEALAKQENEIKRIYDEKDFSKYEFATRFKNYLMTRIKNYKDKYSSKAIEQIRQTSTLPASMKGEVPKSVIEQPLLHRYLQNKGNPEELETWKATLTAEEQQKLEKLIKTLPQEMPALSKDVAVKVPSKAQTPTQTNAGPQTIESWDGLHTIFHLKPNITDEELAAMKEYINALYNTREPSPITTEFKDALMERIKAYEEKKGREKEAASAGQH